MSSAARMLALLLGVCGGAALAADLPAMNHKGRWTATAAFAPDGALWLIEADASRQPMGLQRRLSLDDGVHWQAPTSLDLGTDVPSLGGESPVRLAFGPQGAVALAYGQGLGKKFTGEIRLLTSNDGGAQFSAPRTLHADRSIISHSFVALDFDAKGVLHAVWLDGREKAAAQARASSAAGTARPDYRGSSVFHAWSEDGGAHFSADTKLADSSCECCRIALTRTADGRLAALWRQVLEPNIRDHGFALLDTRSTPIVPVRATFDNWAVDACPHHGPALAPAAQGGYHAVWFGLRDGVPGVRYGRLDAQGQPAAPVQMLPDARAEHADLATLGTRVAIVWRSFNGTHTEVKGWFSDDDGAHFTLRTLADSEADNDYPRLLLKPAHAGQPARLFMLWNTAEVTHVLAL